MARIVKSNVDKSILSGALSNFTVKSLFTNINRYKSETEKSVKCE